MLYVVMLLLTQLISKLIKRFKQRENITENTFDKNIELYYGFKN